MGRAALLARETQPADNDRGEHGKSNSLKFHVGHATAGASRGQAGNLNLRFCGSGVLGFCGSVLRFCGSAVRRFGGSVLRFDRSEVPSAVLRFWARGSGTLEPNSFLTILLS
jgi:hypothetical protein